MFKNKRAVSPLVATLLLVVFAIAIGSVVMSWSKQYDQDSSAASEGSVDDAGVNSLLDDLNQRYENGDITKEQFQELKKVLLDVS